MLAWLKSRVEQIPKYSDMSIVWNNNSIFLVAYLAQNIVFVLQQTKNVLN